MPKILTFNSSPEFEKNLPKDNIFKTLWESLRSQDKFAKLSILTILFVIIATPFIISNYLDFRQFAVVGDTDGDGFSDSVETFIGTNPSLKCSSSANSLAPNDSWPPDVNGDNRVDSSDSNKFTPLLNSKAGNRKYNKRFDLNADRKINSIDVAKATSYMNTSCQAEAEGGASGGGVHESLSEPVRAAFYYGWYPEQWSAAGHRWTSTLGTYDSSSTAIIDKHIEWMKYANIDGGVYSWWGTSHHTNPRFRNYLDRAQVKGFKWGLYYELDWDTKRTIEQIRSDMTYLRDNYLSHPGYMYVNNKPVVFVYMPSVPVGVEGCTQVAKWTAIRNEFNLYISLMEVDQWWTCNTLDSWHGYKPDQYVKGVGRENTVYSLAISAGFWPSWETTPRLVRDFNRWQADIAGFNFYKPKWELVYFNEFGEGTNIEPSNALCSEAECLDYLKILNQTL